MDFVLPPEKAEAYAAAVEHESLVRDAAFLGINETVAGFELRPITLRDYLILKSIKSPLLGTGIPTKAQLISFLWMLSPQFRPGWSISTLINRRLFARRARKRLSDAVASLAALNDCRTYISEAFQDAPFTRHSNPSYFSDACHFITLFAFEFRIWMPEKILSMPLKQLFQFQNRIKLRDQGITAMGNPSDAIRASFGIPNRN